MNKLLTPSGLLNIGLIIFIIILFFWKPCNKDAEQIAQLKAENRQLEIKHKQDSTAFIQQVQRWQDSITTANLNSDMQVNVIKETERKLRESQSEIGKLTWIIRNSKPDSVNGVLVSRDFKDACEEMPDKIDSQNVVIADLQQDNTDLIDLMNYEVIYRDSLIETGRIYIDSLRTDYNTQKGQLNAALKAGKPKGRLLGGVGLIGNEVNFLSGTKINLAYQSKGGKQYQGGAMIFKGGVYYEATVLITLIK